MTHRALVHAWNNLGKLRDLLSPAPSGGEQPAPPAPKTFAKGATRQSA